MITIFRKSVLGLAGAAFAGTVLAGPLAAHTDVCPIEGLAVAALPFGEPDSGKLVAQGAQSWMGFTAEHTAA
ncbi:hypothetical protein GCM10023176_56860 [Micromonospora coerulea]|uniref:Uncharacterized protein n=1 Tax=Micromonospora coerulea TaxID=47856 RepID=A0ABP8T362_9ACTN